MSRTKNSIKNIKYTIMGQILVLLLSFITRMVFVKYLKAEYLGLNGLFSNILSILSLAELGVGASIIYSIYKPLAENDYEKLRGLMVFYKKTYIKIGLFILISGSLLTPFLGYFIKEIPNIPNYRLIFLLYVFNTSFTYFFSYKRSFLIADQKKYLESIYHYSSVLIYNLLQIGILIITRNFLLYLLIQITITFIANILIAKKVDSMYPFLTNLDEASLGVNEKKAIYKNVSAMIFHKIGDVVVMGTDNLLISKIIGLIDVGIYSNYILITQALNQIYSMIFQSLIASIGNLGVTETKEKSKTVFMSVDLLGAWIYGFSSVALFTLLNPFISLWLGNRFLFPPDLVLVIVISFFLTGRRKSVLAFRDALGLFWYDRHKPIYESIINLIASVVLALLIGLKGIVIGTIISTLTTSFWIEPYILHRNGFKSSARKYFINYLIYAAISIFVGIINYWICGYVDGYNFISFLNKFLITLVIPNVLFLLFFSRMKEFGHLKSVILANLFTKK